MHGIGRLRARQDLAEGAARAAQIGFHSSTVGFVFSARRIIPCCYQDPGFNRAENGAAPAGTVHANCDGQPGSLDAFLHSDVEL
jgi:hypothetical protein